MEIVSGAKLHANVQPPIPPGDVRRLANVPCTIFTRSRVIGKSTVVAVKVDVDAARGLTTASEMKDGAIQRGHPADALLARLCRHWLRGEFNDQARPRAQSGESPGADALRG